MQACFGNFIDKISICFNLYSEIWDATPMHINQGQYSKETVLQQGMCGYSTYALEI